MYKKTDFFESTNGCDRIAYYIFEPASEPCAIVQLSHGMCEYIEKYEDFISFLCSNGILVCGHDHLGHGNSAITDDFLGYFAPSKGWQYLSKDTMKMTAMIREQYPELPIFIIGHSLGSLTARVALSKCGTLYDGAIFLGTPDSRLGLDTTLMITRTAERLKGAFYRSAAVDNAVFRLSNTGIENPVNEYAWISRDNSAAEKFAEDPLSNFRLTASAYSDLIMLLMYVSRKEWYNAVNKSLPVLICSGSSDPVGGFGKGAENVFRNLENAGLNDVQLKLYSGARHELLSENNRAEVFEDLFGWINERLK